MRNPYELFELFSVDPRHQGAMDFSELCYRLNAREWFPDMPGAGNTKEIIAGMVKERKLPLRIFYARMKQALRPLLDADPATLDALGIHCAGNTSTAMAAAVAEWMKEGEYAESE